MTDLIIKHKEFEVFFDNQIKNVNTSLRETKAYIHGIFSSYLHSHKDLSKESLTLQYIKAKSTQNFEQFQTLADWTFFVRAAYPESLCVSNEYYDAIAQCSYYKCYVMMNRKWRCFEELADKFPYFVETIQNSMGNTFVSDK